MVLRTLLLGAGLGSGFSLASYVGSRDKQPAEAAGPVALSSKEFRSFKLISSKYETHDTRRFLFATPDPDMELGLPTASCVVVKFTDTDGKEIIRPYTPISSSKQKGTFEFMVKRYPKSKMGSHMFGLRPGEELEIKGPIMKFPYTANSKKHIAMIAGGTGVAPMYQVIRTVLENPKDKTKITLLYSNKERKDLILANELCELQKTYPNFHMYVSLTQAVPKRWLGGVGHISNEVLTAFLPKPGEKDTMVLVCGPPSMMKAISGDKDYSKQPPGQGEIAGTLKELGYTSDQVFKF